MADKRMNLELYAKVKADVSDMELKVKSIKDQLSTLEMPRTAAKGFEKVFKDFENQVINFKAEASKGIGSVEDVAKISRAWDKVVLSLSKAGVELEGIDTISSKIFPKEVAQNIKAATDKLSDYEKKIEKIQKSPEYKKKEAERAHLIRTSPSESALAERQNAVQRAQARKEAADQAFGEKERQQIAYLQQERGRLSKITKSNVTSPEIENLRKQIVTLQNKKILTKENKITARVGQAITGAEDLLKEAGLDFSDPKALLSQLKRKHGTYASAAQRTKTTAEKEGATQAQKDKAINADARLNNLENQIAALETLINNTKDIEKGEKAASDLDKAINAKLSETKQQKAQAEAEIAKLQSLSQEKIDASANYSKESKELAEMQQAAISAKEAIARLDQEMSTMTTDQAEAEWQALSEEIKKITGIDISGFKGDLSKVNEALDQYKGENLAKVPGLIEKIQNAYSQTAGSVERTNKVIRETGDTAKSIKKASDEADHLKSSFMQFFSISNTIQLFKRAIKDAFDTVKQLDKAMTETAVVTDFSVGDMWKKLPEYTALANDLGTTTLGAYETMTLFYQQGLKTEEAFGVGTEAMKMARIAGLDYANATNLMTAALRGFNMEVNESSAQRINDVYSELAAITAADTQEIATAMTKTASIAHNAGMDFETTSAFLTQIIETTRESAETAGTAMKTVIARFQEMRKSPAEIGEVDGEFVDANKIEAALRSVGVALRDDVTGQFRELDDVFLELASKWDGLDTNTQRYIATIAAGSRQQSRFLAMMSDYDRTMELVTAANESAGASQRQFDKTLDSLESKLNKLKNAWDEFTMGLSNSSLIKGGVDLLTKLLSTINGLTKGFSSASSSFLKLAISFGTLRSGWALFNAFDNSLVDILTEPNGERKNFIKGLGDIFQDLGNIGKKRGKFLEKKFLQTSIFDSLEAQASGALKSLASLGKGFISFIFSPAGLATGAIIGLTTAIIFFIKSVKKASKSNQIEAISKNIQELEDNLKETKGSIKDIGDAKDEFKGFRAEIDELIEGTQAWNEALVKVNDQVLKLTDEYPILGQHLETINGMLNIKDSGWEALIEQQYKTSLYLQNSIATEQLHRSKVQQSYNFDQMMIDSQADQAKTKMGAWITRTADKWGADLNNWAFDKKLITQNEVYRNQQSLSGGLTEKEFFKLAQKAYLNKQYINDEQTGKITFSKDNLRWIEKEWAAAIPEGEYKQDLEKDKYGNYVGTFLGDLESHAADFIESGKKYYEEDLEKQRVQSGFIKNIVEFTDSKEKNGVEDEALSNLLFSTKYSDLEQSIEDTANSITLTGSKLKEEYHRITGKGYLSGGEIYSDKDFTQKMNIDDVSMKRAIASANITQEIQEMIEGPNGISEALAAKSDDQIDLINKLFSKDGNGLTQKDILNFTDEGGSFNDKDAISLGFKDLEDMRKAFGVELKALTTMISSNLEKAQKRIAKERKDLSVRMAKNESIGDKNTYTSAIRLSALENFFGEKIRDTLNGVYDSIEQSEDQTLITSLGNSFQDIAMRDAANGKEVNTKEAKKFIDSIDFKNPLQVVKKLNEGLASSNEEIRQLAYNALASGSSFLTMGNRIQTFLKTDAFSNLQEDIKDIRKESGDLTASNILDLKDSYEELDDIIEQTGATTEGLAEIFNQLSDGEMTINQMTDAVLASLSGFESLDSLIAETLSSLSKFDPGMNENEVTDFISQAYETLSGNLEKGAYGNNQNFTYLDYLLGPGWDKNVPRDQLDEYMSSIASKLEANKDNMKKSWSDLAAGQDFYGNKAGDLNGLEIHEQGKEIILEGYEGKTTEEIVSTLQQAYHVSENYARMMLADFKNYSTDLATELNTNDYLSAVNSAFDVIKEKGFVDESELATIDRLYGQEIGTTLASINKKISGDPKLKGSIDITNFFDKDGAYKSIKDIYANLNEISGGDWLKKKNLWYETNERGIISYQGTMQELSRYDFDEQQKIEVLQEAINSRFDEGAQAVSFYYDTIREGQNETEITLKKGESLAAAIKAEDLKAEAEAYAEAAGEVFKNIFSTEGFNLKFDADGSLKDITGKIKDLSSITPDITLKPEHTALDNAAQAWDNHRSTIYLDYTIGKGGFLAAAVGVQAETKAASGLKDSPKRQTALVGEGKGPELIQTKKGFYMSGLAGPEITTLEKGDTVYTAEETKKILQGSKHQIYPRFEGGTPRSASGYGGATSGGSTGKGGGGRGSKGDKQGTEWKNTFDMLYNLLRQINEEQRERNRIERRYEQEVKKIGTSTSQLLKISIEELKQLDFEKQAQKALYERRGAELDAYIAKNSQFKEYGDVSTNEYGERVIRIDWEKIDAIEDQDLYKDVEEYIKQLEEWVDEMADVEDTINDIDDQIEEIKERGKDQYLDLEQRIKDALLKQKQDEIDELTEIDKTISEGNSKIVSAMEDSIAKQREDRENEKTEKNLQEKYRQKAYLEQDTSNANDLDILALQKEISEGEQDYTDILIDQKISELQKQNEEASQERQQQIAILTAQMGFYERTGQVWEDVHRILEDSLDDENSLIHGSALELLLQNSDSWLGLSELSKVDWLEKLENQVSEGMAFIELSKKNSDEMKETLKQIASTPKGSGGSTHYTPPSSSGGGGGGGGGGSGYGGVPRQSTASVTYTYYYHSNGKIGSYQKTVSATGSTWEEARKKAQRQADGASSESRRQAQNAQQVYLRSHGRIEEANNAFKRYATGGLANFTGPAWLDGTKSKPEMVLNARDTENFIALRDVLESLRGSNPKQVVQNDGDNTYDIDINVETIRDDYDVESIANKVERLINQKARYRNNNTIGIMR